MSACDSVSVIICVHSDKRWDAIFEAVHSVRSQSRPVLETLIVVDHNAELERRLEESLPGVTVVPNSQDRGLSGARNTGVALAKGALLLFLDDDAALEPDWVREAMKHFGSGKTMGVTSRIVPQWQGIRPFWFPDEFLWVVGCTYEGMRPGAVRNLIGAAMCVRRDLFSSVGGFNHRLGRSGGRLPMGCEETELCIRAGAAFPGSAFIFDAKPCAFHVVGDERLTVGYFIRRCFAEGKSKAALAAVAPPSAALSTERRYVLSVLPRGVLRGMSAFFHGDIGGLGRASAIIGGFIATLVGYLSGMGFRKGGRLAHPLVLRGSGEPR
ncbi:glycosyltransferase family 2 protein [Hyphomicrobium facile]|uniref:Glycosyltransferase, GT2 family n=1 Tax=Hyphomicrobium facile TaxID=51670 RepID=A0A1I7N5N0_9HYPH|nr:glycosyltransferase family 2 protein [Hyphomicrobium facile]SFV29962.1 Glycosyltransferase, GT2 family [Hyphomicrobium facile]